MIIFAYKQAHNQSSKQILIQRLRHTLILCGYSGERANKRGDSTVKEEVRRRKIRKFASKQTDKEQRINGSNTEATLILCGYSGERANISTKFCCVFVV